MSANPSASHDLILLKKTDQPSEKISCNTNGSEKSSTDEISKDVSETMDTTFKANDDPQKIVSNSLERQVCRIEAKLNNIQSTLSQLHRAIITSTIDSIDENQFPELPLDTEDSMNKFEKDLCDKSFRKKAVSIMSILIVMKNIVILLMRTSIFFSQEAYLISLNGIGGAKDGSKIVRSVVLSTISSELLSTYTWTGRSQNSNKKAFESKKNIINLLYTAIRAYDSSYSEADCSSDLKYKIFKYAYRKYVV